MAQLPLDYMTYVTCTRRIQFCAGHRVMGHENKCAHLHGHNYVAEITATAPKLDAKGRVIDFIALKETVGKWIDTHWDHGFIYHPNDEAVRKAIAAFTLQRREEDGNTLWEPFHQKSYMLRDAPLERQNPTAENMAWYLLNIVCPYLLDSSAIKVVKVRLWETDNCYADAEERGWRSTLA